MKKYLLAFGLIVSQLAFGQPTWTIKHNNKLASEINTEDKSNVITINKSDLEKKGSLTISYIKTAEDSAWNRTVILADSSLEGHPVKKTPGLICFSVPNSVLKDLLITRNKKPVIYTVSIPSDPVLAASVRVRQVFLCSIELK